MVLWVLLAIDMILELIRKDFVVLERLMMQVSQIVLPTDLVCFQLFFRQVQILAYSLTYLILSKSLLACLVIDPEHLADCSNHQTVFQKY